MCILVSLMVSHRTLFIYLYFLCIPQTGKSPLNYSRLLILLSFQLLSNPSSHFLYVMFLYMLCILWFLLLKIELLKQCNVAKSNRPDPSSSWSLIAFVAAVVCLVTFLSQLCKVYILCCVCHWNHCLVSLEVNQRISLQLLLGDSVFVGLHLQYLIRYLTILPWSLLPACAVSIQPEVRVLVLFWACTQFWAST